MQSVANFDTPPWRGLSLSLTRTQCRHLLRNGWCVNSCCSASDALGKTNTFPGVAGCASRKPRRLLLQAHHSILVPPVTVRFGYPSNGSLQNGRLGRDLEVARHVDSVTGAHEDLCATRCGESLPSGPPEFHTPTPLGLPSRLSVSLCWHTDVAAPESIKNSF